MIGRFPFGSEVRSLKQEDRSPKRVFVLGVYASAVHAEWRDTRNKLLVRALAVASEPCIFWPGNDAAQYIPRIPAEAGSLVAANESLNGPSGRALDDLILSPLRVDRKKSWLCDLVPHSCANAAQKAAIARAYAPLVQKLGLPRAAVPDVPAELADEARREAILAELKESQATTLVLLGDMPIRWFVQPYAPSWKRLSDFIAKGRGYGEPVSANIGGIDLELLPLAHPRQIAGLGASSKAWADRHASWMRKR